VVPVEARRRGCGGSTPTCRISPGKKWRPCNLSIKPTPPLPPQPLPPCWLDAASDASPTLARAHHSQSASPPQGASSPHRAPPHRARSARLRPLLRSKLYFVVFYGPPGCRISQRHAHSHHGVSPRGAVVSQPSTTRQCMRWESACRVRILADFHSATRVFLTSRVNAFPRSCPSSPPPPSLLVLAFPYPFPYPFQYPPDLLEVGLLHLWNSTAGTWVGEAFPQLCTMVGGHTPPCRDPQVGQSSPNSAPMETHGENTGGGKRLPALQC